MAYITQQQIDGEQEAKRSAFAGQAANAIGLFEENRRRALAEKRQAFDTSMKFAEIGIAPTAEESEELAQTGHSQGLFDKYSNTAAEARRRKQERDLEDATLDREFKKSQIEINKRKATEPVEVKADPVEIFNKKLEAKAVFDNKNKINGKNAQEFNSRMQNILGEAEQVKALIAQNGTYEAFGPHNANLAMKIDSMAIDAAKLFDPESVAREGEVAAFKKMLFEPGTLSTSNNTALGTLDGFQKLIKDRAARSRGEEVKGDQTGQDQKINRLNELRAKKAQAMGGQ